MSSGDVITVARQTVWVIVKTAVPILLVSMIVGLVISLFQTLTSIQEQTLAFIPKIIAVFVAILIFGPWMLRIMTEYVTNIFVNLPLYIG